MQYHYFCFFFYSGAQVQIMMGRQPRSGAEGALDPSLLYIWRRIAAARGNRWYRILLLLRSHQITTLDKFANYYGVSYTGINNRYCMEVNPLSKAAPRSK